MSEVQGGNPPTINPEDNSTAGEMTRLWPAVGRYRKLVAAVVTTSVPFAIFLCDPRTTKEVIAAAGSWLLVNLGVFGVSND